MSELEKWRGDLGLTDLIDRADVSKDDLRIVVLGELDEASSALGMVRACPTSPETKAMVLEIQRDLCWMMSELASMSTQGNVPTHITEDRVRFLQQEFHDRFDHGGLGNAFVVPGDSPTSATVHLARAIVRRAERSVTRLHREVGLANGQILPYLNRLSALLYVLARAEDLADGRPTTRAHPSTQGPPVPQGSSG